MHRLQSRSALRSFRLGTLLLVVFGGTLLAAILLGALGLINGDSQMLRWFLIAIAATPVVGTGYLAVGSRARCPLCMNPPIVPRRCQKHRNARRLFGSHRLRVASSILLTGSFTCPYCGERTALELHERKRR